MKLIQRLLVLLITVTMLLSGSFVQVFAAEETADGGSVVMSGSAADSAEDTVETKDDKTPAADADEKADAPADDVKAGEPAEEKSNDTAADTAEEAKNKDAADEKGEEPAETAATEEAEEPGAGKLIYECDDYTVTLEYGEKAGIPEGTVLDIREILADSEDKTECKEYKDYYDTTLEQLRSEKGGDAIAKLGFARFYDITLISGDKEIEPGDDVKLTFTYNKDSRESVKESNNEEDAIRVIHLTGSEETGEIKAEPIEKKDTDLTLENKELKKAEFNAESFSVYGIVYTVDFEYEGYTYSIAGESEIMLSALFARLKIEDSVEDVNSVEFTDCSLIRIEEADGDWRLVSLKSFKTEEKLTVTLEDKIIEIKVTDSDPGTAVARVSGDGGSTWTYHDVLVDNGTQTDGTYNGAFDQANSLNGEVIVELLKQDDSAYTMDSGFTFNNNNITSLTINGTNGKSTLTKNQTTAPMITTTGINTVNISSIVFNGNGSMTVLKNGGAVNTDAHSLTVSDCAFNNCQAGKDEEHTNGFGQGGGIYHSNADATVEITNTTFTGCRANGTGPDGQYGGGGGGFFTDALKLTVTDSTFDKCTTRERQGAGFFHKRVNGDPVSYCTVTGCSFNDCVSSHGGGGFESDAWHTTVKDSSFSGCKANKTDNAKGGAINVWADGKDDSSADTSLIIENCTFDGCTSIQQGGAVRSTALQTTISGSSFKECLCSAHSGGAVSCTNKNATAASITDCEFNDCHADNGNGGAWFSNAKSNTISGTSANKTAIINCSAKNGGAIYAQNLTVNNGTISGCSASANGGAIYGNSTITITDGTIGGCSATEKGGAIYGNSTITMIGGTVTGNTTGGNSAAVDANTKRKGIFFQGNVVIEGNTGSDGKARDVYIGFDTDQHICINKEGLGDSASIGVYIENTTEPAFTNHGQPGQMFATTDPAVASTVSNLDKLFSDRLDNGAMHGAPAESGSNSQKRVMWVVSQEPVAPTAVNHNYLPYILILIGGVAIMLMKIASDRRKRPEDNTEKE